MFVKYDVDNDNEYDVNNDVNKYDVNNDSSNNA